MNYFLVLLQLGVNFSMTDLIKSFIPYFTKPIYIILILLLIVQVNNIDAQIDNDGCVAGNFGIDAGLYSDLLEFGDHGGASAPGTNDWFQTTGGTGVGVIDETEAAAILSLLQAGGNPSFEVDQNFNLTSVVNGQILIDAIWARDEFGGTGYTDPTSFATASKNGEDPAIWDPGESNVLGKVDLIDIAGHMWRAGSTLADDLWFFGLINIAEPGGSSYMDFEFFMQELTYDASTGFSSGGPQLGHTAFVFDGSGNITKVGDIILNISLINGGETADAEVRIWVSRDDYDNMTPASGSFTWGTEFDGPYTGSPYGYASIVTSSSDACGVINPDGSSTPAAPWGTLGTKSNVWSANYAGLSVVELGINLSNLGVDHASLVGLDQCDYPIKSFIVKSRSSAAFTASLKDFAGPFSWGGASIGTEIVGSPLLSCDNPIVTLQSDPVRTDVTYLWTTVDGNILTDPTLASINVDEPGTYVLSTNLDATGCDIEDVEIEVGYDPAKPFFTETTVETTTSCSGNDGSINITVNGGTPPFSYDWDNDGLEDPDDDSQDLSGLSGGTYEVIITDALNCTTSATAIVDSRTATNISLSGTNLDCYNDGTGAIDATVTGASPFSYSWSNGIISEDLNGLDAGSYTLTTTDADGCAETESITITSPSEISLSISITDESDPDNDDGEIDLSVSGGTPTYTYDWDNDGLDDPDDDSQDLTGLSSGTYTVIVTDDNGCTATISATILEPEICDDGIDNDGDGLTDCFDPDCTPGNPGAISASASSVCVGDVGVTYTIVDIGAPSYTWTVPDGASITAGQGTNEITVSWVSNIGGQICVMTNNVGCTSSASSCIDIDLSETPATPDNINVDGQ